MGKKTSLPLFSTKPDLPVKPSIRAARARLGGKAEQEDGIAPVRPGQLVVLKSSAAPDAAGAFAVVLFATASEVHVLEGPRQLRRVAPSDVELHGGSAPPDLLPVATDAHVFGMLAEGQAVRYADADGTLLGGRLVEKCRYGALVLRDDGIVVAVGFRKLWPAAAGSAA